MAEYTYRIEKEFCIRRRRYRYIIQRQKPGQFLWFPTRLRFSLEYDACGMIEALKEARA